MKRRRLFSMFVGITSVLAAVSLYLAITGLTENASTDRDVRRIAERVVLVERPTPHELANRVRLGLRRCERERGCVREIERFLARRSP